MSCVPVIIAVGTSGKVIASWSVQVTQQETTLVLPGTTSFETFTTESCSGNTEFPVCHTTTGTRTLVTKGETQVKVVPVTITKDVYTTEFTTLYSTSSSCAASQTKDPPSTVSPTPPISPPSTPPLAPLTTTISPTTTPPTTTIISPTTTPPTTTIISPTTTPTTTTIISPTTTPPTTTVSPTAPTPPPTTVSPTTPTPPPTTVSPTTPTPPPTTVSPTPPTPPPTTVSPTPPTPPPTTVLPTTPTTISTLPQTSTTPPTPLSPPSSIPQTLSKALTVIPTSVSVSTTSASAVVAYIPPTVTASDIPTGPIVGGVIGGVVGVALLGIVIYHTIFAKSTQGGRALRYERDSDGEVVETQENNGQPFNQNFSQMQEWSGNQLYSPPDHMQGQLVQMQNTENLHNMALHDQGLQQSQQLVQGSYDSQYVAQPQGQGVYYPQADAGQYALHGGQSQPMQGQGFQYSQPDAGHGQLYNQNFTQTQTQGLYGNWYGNQWYSPVDPMQGLASMQTADTLQNVAFQDHGLQQSQPLAQTHGHGVHYPQADAGQHALHGGGSQYMQGQDMQYPQADAGQHALHAGDIQHSGLQQTQGLLPGVHGAEYPNAGQLQATVGIPGMAQGHAAAIAAGASLGASVGAVSAAKVVAKSTAKSGKHKHFARSSSSSTSSLISKSDVDPYAGIEEEGPSQTFSPYPVTPFILSSARPDDPQPSSSATSGPSSVTPFIPRYTSMDYTEPLKPSSGRRSSKADP